MKPTSLLPQPNADLIQALNDLPAFLQKVSPLKPKHRRFLPQQVAELSALLTTEREDLPPDYMSRPPLLAAYLRFFFPWNILRQGRLLQGLGSILDLPEGAKILDIGAGPLTFPLALWLAQPALRQRKLHYRGLDRSESALKLGRSLLQELAPNGPWSVELSRSDIQGRGTRQEQVDLLVLANVLNEMDRPGSKRGDRHADSQRRQEQWLQDWSRRLRPGGRVLIIEPGVRSSGKLLTELRAMAMTMGWQITSPCPHGGECPQPGTGRGPWCHFAVPALGAPGWLQDLATAAELPKQRLSLSLLVLERAQDQVTDSISEKPGPEVQCLVRIMSDSLLLPGGRRGVYGCSERGLVLVELSPGVLPAQGDLLSLSFPDKARRDKKSGALVVTLPAAKVVQPRHKQRRR